MKLHEHIARRKVSISGYGRRIGVRDRSSMRRYALGLRIPPPQVIIEIYLESKGEVAPNDFYDLPPLQLELQQSEAA